MRIFSSAVKQILKSDAVEVVYFVKTMTAVPTYDTTATVDTVYDGNTYLANSGLMLVEPPKLSEVVDRQAYKITYSGIDSAKLSEFENGITGKKVTVYACFVNTTGTVVNGKLPGELLTSTLDTLLAYEGVVDKPGYTVSPNNGSIVAVLECSSPVANLGMSKGFYTSKESMNRLHPLDTAFDEVAMDSEASAFVWGRV
jgi:hypothetical protein